MKRHRFDALSFVFGLSFLAIAVVCSPLVATGGTAIHTSVLRWIGIGFLMLMGLALILAPRPVNRDSAETR